MTIKKIKITKINPAPYNPRKDLQPDDPEYRKLKISIEKFGLVEPLIWNQKTGNLVGGHQRLKILQDRGDQTVSVSVVDLDDADEKALNIALNKISGEWDEGKLAELLGELSELPDFDIELTGFDVDEVTALQPIKEPVEDNFNTKKALDTIDEPVTKLGDVILLGKHRLMCGDSTKMADVEILMDGQKADMVFTDPPYGVSYSDKNEFLNAIDKGNRIQAPIINDSKTVPEMSDMWVEAFTLMNKHSKKGASYYVCSPQGGELMMMMMMILSLQKAGWQLKHSIIWVKNNHVLGRSDYHYKHEPILYGWNEGTHHFYGGSSKFSVWNFDKPHKSDLHPTMKPVLLICEGIQNSSKPEEIVIDLFLGSGSTLIASEQTSRICYGMELDPKYCDVITKRWEEFTGKKATRP